MGYLLETNSQTWRRGSGAADQFGSDIHMAFVDQAMIEQATKQLPTTFAQNVGGLIFVDEMLHQFRQAIVRIGTRDATASIHQALDVC